jgi:hypothetical protein
MGRIRDWAFPIGLGVAWSVTAVYVLLQLTGMYMTVRPHPSTVESPAAVIDTEQPELPGQTLAVEQRR